MVAVIDITDAAASLYVDGERIARSPGFAIVEPRQLRIGEEAAAEWRRHPRHAVTGFWSNLSTERMPITGHRAERWADLAWAQLQQLWAAGTGAGNEVVFAVPSGFSAEQLSILLGISQQCDFQVVGMVNRLVAAWAASLGPCERATVLDVSLERSQLLELAFDGHQVSVQGQRDFPDTGLLALQTSWVALIADRFIKETRFDPLHDGRSEQHVYLNLDGWLDSERDAVDIQIEHGSTTHRVTIEQEAFTERSRSRLREILNAIAGSSAPLVLSEPAGQVPTLRATLGTELPQLSESAIASGVIEHIERIRGDGSGVAYVDRLPLDPGRPQPAVAQAPAPATARDPQPSVTPTAASPEPVAAIPENSAAKRRAELAATHVLVGSEAYPLAADRLRLGRAASDGRQATLPGLPGHLCDVRIDGHQPIVDNPGPGGVLINGVRLTGSHVLTAGDLIEAAETGVQIQAIRVRSESPG